VSCNAQMSGSSPTPRLRHFYEKLLDLAPTGDDQGRHFIQEDSPVEIGTALADFVTAVDARSR